MTGHGGWPLTAFLDTETSPFYCGTYFPPEPRHGMPSFRMVMEAVVASWETKRAEIAEQAGRIRERLAATARDRARRGRAHPRAPRPRAGDARRGRGPVNGGFGGGAQVPARVGDRVPPGARRARGLRASPRRDARRRDLRPGRRRLRPLLGGRESGSSRTSRRCSTTTLFWPAPTSTASRRTGQSAGERPASARSTGCSARCAGPKAASSPRWTPTRRATKAASTSGPRTEFREVLADAGLADAADDLVAYWGVSAQGNFEGKNILHLPGGAGRSHPQPRSGPRRALRAPRPPGLARPRRQAHHVVERARHRRACRRRRRAWPSRLLGRCPDGRRVRVG